MKNYSGDRNWWLKKSSSRKLIDHFSSHLVALVLSVEEDGEERMLIYSGFVLRIMDQLFWFTAAHVLREIVTISRSEKIELKESRWWDQYNLSEAPLIPTDIDSWDLFEFQDAQFDVASVRFNYLETQCLLVPGGIVPLDERYWNLPDDHCPDGHFLVGWPASMVQTEKTTSRVTASVACLPFIIISYNDELASSPIGGDPEAIYGEIVPHSDGGRMNLVDVKGMSGGPVFSVERLSNDSVRYQLVGIQRSWISSKGIIRAESLESIISAFRSKESDT